MLKHNTSRGISYVAVRVCRIGWTNTVRDWIRHSKPSTGFTWVTLYFCCLVTHIGVQNPLSFFILQPFGDVTQIGLFLNSLNKPYLTFSYQLWATCRCESHLISGYVTAVSTLRSEFMFFCLFSFHFSYHCCHHWVLASHRPVTINMEDSNNSDRGQWRDKKMVNLLDGEASKQAKLEGTYHNTAILKEIAWEMAVQGSYSWWHHIFCWMCTSMAF